MSSITINSNISSLVTQRQLGQATSSLEKSFTRLSSGLRINRASDDAAGLSIAESLNVDSRVYAQGMRNINDGISVLSIAEGAIAELSAIVIRIRELATQSANGAISSKQRESLDQEAQALRAEFSRIQQSTKFNDMGLLNGETNGVLIQAGYGTGGQLAAGVGELLGDGTFSEAISSTISSTYAISLADLNRDGLLDMVTDYTFFPNKVLVSLANGDGSFKQSSSFSAPYGVTSVDLADLNDDGIIDAITTGSRLAVMYGNGDGSLKSAISYYSGGDSTSTAFGDVNGDGFLDIATGNHNSTLGILLANGDGTFKNSITSPVDYDVSEISLVDLNGDGFLDIISAVTSGASVLIGNGDGTFKSEALYSAGNGVYSVQQGDVNGDGILDIVTNDYYNNAVSVLIGNGDATFNSPDSYSAGNAPNTVRIADLNGDGSLDLAAKGSSDLTILLGNGDGTFEVGLSFAVGDSSRISLGDLDGDGILDLANAGATGVSIVLGNTREGINPLLDFSLKTKAGALQAMAPLDRKLEKLNAQRGVVGSYQSRLGVSLNILDVGRENFKFAESRIRDADIAGESAMLVKNKILQQAAAAVLSQANQGPTLALALLS